MNIGWPEIIWLVLTGVGLGMDITRHGKERTVTSNLWVDLAASLTVFALLYWGGFFA